MPVLRRCRVWQRILFVVCAALASDLVAHARSFDMEQLDQEIQMIKAPPNGMNRYRLITGTDDAAFEQLVSQALALGYKLHEGPAISTDDDGRIVTAQAVIWTEWSGG